MSIYIRYGIICFALAVWYGCGVVPTQFIMIDLTLPEHIKGTGQGIVNIKSKYIFYINRAFDSNG